MEYQLVDVHHVMLVCPDLVGGDVQQLPLPHGGHDMLGVLCDVFGTFCQKKLNI